MIFAGVPDITAWVTARAVRASSIWTEWEMNGTRLDGTRHAVRGVIIFAVQDGRATSARFYLEPVEQSSDDVETFVRGTVSARPS
jgi:hypothetical protein